MALKIQKWEDSVYARVLRVRRSKYRSFTPNRERILQLVGEEQRQRVVQEVRLGRRLFMGHIGSDTYISIDIVY